MNRTILNTAEGEKSLTLIQVVQMERRLKEQVRSYGSVSQYSLEIRDRIGIRRWL
jgi:hypothetical protein